MKYENKVVRVSSTFSHFLSEMVEDWNKEGYRVISANQSTSVTGTSEYCIFLEREINEEVTIDDLINRKNAEIKALQHEILSCNSEIEKFNGDLIKERIYHEAKAEAIKEFAERLKECCYTHSDICGFQSTVIDVQCVDTLLKEMSGD